MSPVLRRRERVAAPVETGELPLRARALTVSYGSVEAVKGIDLEVHNNETVALLGANGAGKTSTLRALSRLAVCSGDIHFEGRELTHYSPDAIARQGLIMVPEGRRLFATLSCDENLQVGLTARNHREPLFTIADIYDLFPALSSLRRRGAWSLSGGEQQMVAIGRALLSAPRLLLLDEPSLGLAPVAVSAVYQALKSISHRVSMILVEQNASLALDLCDRAYVLSVGRVSLAGTPAELSSREDLLESYLARGGPDPAEADEAAAGEGGGGPVVAGSESSQPAHTTL
jgi:branched-chain amino acid transport system ATP-binding protein